MYQERIMTSLCAPVYVYVCTYVRTYVHIHGQARPRGAAINGLASSPNSVFVTAYVAFEPSAVLSGLKAKGQVCG